jgi:excisionase family DNA binding protein
MTNIYPTNPDPLLSIKEAARYLSISVTTMRKLIKILTLPIVKLTSDIKIRKSTLDNLIRMHETELCQTAEETQKENWK